MTGVDRFLSVLFMALLASAIIGFILWHKLIVYIEVNHPEKWKTMGSPSAYWFSSIKSTLVILSFLRNKEYLQINDSQLSNMSQRLWIYNIIYIAFFLLVLLVSSILLYCVQ